MNEYEEIISQTNIAFDFIDKLFYEVSYLIKEIEGILADEEEKFVIVRPSGYGITSRSSSGLETNSVKFWLLKRFSFAFIPETMTKLVKGQTITEINNNLKLLYFRIILNDKSKTEPVVVSGVFNEIIKSGTAKWVKKYEHLMGVMEYNSQKIFKNLQKIDYTDSYVSLKGKFFEKNLLSINNSEAIANEIVKPLLKLFRIK